MSTAAFVPETRGWKGETVWVTLRSGGLWLLLVNAFKRMRVSDGFTHARSLAFMTVLVAFQGLIAVVGVASAVGEEGLGRAAEEVTRAAAPGPVGAALLTAIDEARRNGGSERYLAIGFGLVGALVSTTTAMGQLQRSFNRLYGIEKDRPSLQKYGRAFCLALSAGALITLAFAAIAFGGAIGDSMGDHALTPVWGIARLPLSLLLLIAAETLLLRMCPNRRQPSWSWLAPGAALSIFAWALVTIGLGWVLSISTSFGDAYGSLAGIVALLLWALLSSIALHYGAAVAAELEAVRANRPDPERPVPSS